MLSCTPVECWLHPPRGASVTLRGTQMVVEGITPFLFSLFWDLLLTYQPLLLKAFPPRKMAFSSFLLPLNLKLPTCDLWLQIFLMTLVELLSFSCGRSPWNHVDLHPLSPFPSKDGGFPQGSLFCQTLKNIWRDGSIWPTCGLREEDKERPRRKGRKRQDFQKVLLYNVRCNSRLCLLVATLQKPL